MTRTYGSDDDEFGGLEPVTGIEPANCGLQDRCSTNESFTGPRVFVSVDVLLTTETIISQKCLSSSGSDWSSSLIGSNSYFRGR